MVWLNHPNVILMIESSKLAKSPIEGALYVLVIQIKVTKWGIGHIVKIVSHHFISVYSKPHLSVTVIQQNKYCMLKVFIVN